MILKALSDYYDILSSQEDSGIAKPGYSQLGVNFAAVISSGGELLQLVPLKVRAQRGKKEVDLPQQMQLPQQVKKTVGFVSNTLYESPNFAFGLDTTGKPERAKRCFEAFRDQQHKVLDGVDCPQAVALLQYVDHWDPTTAAQHPALLEQMDILAKGGNIVFRLGGGYVHDTPEVRQAWDRYYNSADDTPVMQCLVTGKRGPIARLHPSIKGIRGSAPTGAALVSFNDRAYESYGYEKLQGLNAPVGESTVFAYTTALNYLIADSAHKLYMGDTTIVFWAQSPKKIYANVFALQVNPASLYREAQTGELAADEKTASAARRFFEKIAQGKPADRFDETLEEGVQFCVLGLAPNVARLSVRFFLSNTFGNFSKNLARHHRDMYLPRYSDREPEFYSLDWILKETVAPTSREKAASPLMSGAAMRAILTGGPYPASLYQMTLLRIKAERSINRCKAGIIKAYLTRKYPNDNSFKEVLQVALNETSENRAYRLGGR